MRKIVLAALLVTANMLPGQWQSPLPATTADERTHALAAIADLEANPLGPKQYDERTYVLHLLLERSDIRVVACMTLLADLPKAEADNYIISMQVLYSSAAWAIRHNGGDPDSLQQRVAGVKGALHVYQVLLRTRPQDRNPKIDAILELRDAGKLKSYVAQRAASCK